MDYGITPDAQLRLLDVIERWGVWAGLSLFVLVIYRKEIGELLLSFKREHNADALMHQIAGSFDKNLDHFKDVKAQAEIIAGAVLSHVQISRDILTALNDLQKEMIRRGRE